MKMTVSMKAMVACRLNHFRAWRYTGLSCAESYHKWVTLKEATHARQYALYRTRRRK